MIGIKGKKFQESAYQQHRYWKHIWEKAYQNMPVRHGIWIKHVWVERKPMPVGDYILKVAKKEICVREDGKEYERVTESVKRYTYGQLAALTRCLGFHKHANGKPHKTGHRVTIYHKARGTQPGDPNLATILEMLASPDGRELALSILDAQGVGNHYRRPPPKMPKGFKDE